MPFLFEAKEQLRTTDNTKKFFIAASALAALAVIILANGYHSGFAELNALSNQLIPAEVWGVITLFGDALIYIALAATICSRWPQYIWYFFLGGVPQALIVNGIKHLSEMDRPLAVLASKDFHHYGPPHDWGSFPSGHTATAALGCGLVLALSKSKLLAASAISIAVLVGLSRIALGVHWPIDILAGAAIGLVNAGLAIHIGQRWGGGLNKWPYAFLMAVMAFCCYQLIGHDGGYPWAGYLSPILAISGFIGLGLCLQPLLKQEQP